MEDEGKRTGGLVIDRKVGQRLFIDFEGVRVDVMVTETRGSMVSLHLVAPLSVKILREELDGIPAKVRVPA